MQELVEKLKENSILEILCVSLLRGTVKSGTIITKDKKMYKYSFHEKMTSLMKNNNIPLEEVSLIKELTDEEYDKILKFIEEEIINKKYESDIVHDTLSTVFCSYKDKTFSYHDCYDINTKERLYNKTAKLIEEVK